jgi:hypothetical protein
LDSFTTSYFTVEQRAYLVIKYHIKRQCRNGTFFPNVLHICK